MELYIFMIIRIEDFQDDLDEPTFVKNKKTKVAREVAYDKRDTKRNKRSNSRVKPSKTLDYI